MAPRHTYTDEEFKEAIKSSTSVSGALSKLGVVPAGGNYKTLYKRAAQLNIDTSHFTGQSWRKGSTIPVKCQPLEEILVENSTYVYTSFLKKRLIREGLLEEVCSSCRLIEWMGAPIPLELDHINGVNNDHRIGNLRLLCPNCHALTKNYRGKNIGKSEASKWRPEKSA